MGARDGFPMLAADGDSVSAPRPRPLISVIVPCRNEERYIGACLDSIAATTYPADRMEVIVADGRSRDRTRDIVADRATRYPSIRLIDNPGGIAPTALNAGIRTARGEIIVRMDAHALYPPEYLTQLVDALEETGADNVGGCLVTLPADPSPVARAIARALGHPLGVGNSHFRIGSRARRWVDTVPFGCFRRDVFDRVGMFDEELVRNQDDEFNFRLIRQGGRVLLDPAIVAYYYARSSFRQLGRMYYQYGYFKPLVARKVGRVMTGRQLVPPAFVASVTTTGAVALAEPVATVPLAIVLALYAGTVVGSAALGVRGTGVRVALALVAAFVTLHASYGFGYLRGLLALGIGGRRQPPPDSRDPSGAGRAETQY